MMAAAARNRIAFVGFALIVALAIGTVLRAQAQDQTGAPTTQPATVTQAIAVLHPTQGNQVSGIVRFTQTDGGVRVVANVKNLPPDSTHGFHIHEFGDCSAPDATSAGGHYNPTDAPHAGPHDVPRHAGDLGNITSDASGNAHLELTLDKLSIAGPANPILGRAVIVHAKADDLKSQPTGDAGGRVACGVIGVANPKGQ